MAPHTITVDYIATLRQNLRFVEQAKPADAAVLVAITDEAEPKILLTRRAADMRHHGGEVSFPGGKRDPDDQDNSSVALREAWEETALQAENVTLLGELPRIKSKNGLMVKPVVGLIPPHLPLVPEPSEIDRIFYLPLSHFIQSQPSPHALQWGEQRLYFPSIHYDGEVIWGLTARVLVALLQYGLMIEKEWPFLLLEPTTIVP